MIAQTITCASCIGQYVVKIKAADYIAWKNGALIQKVAPYLSVSERELLISETCETCWNEIFSDDEEEV